MKFEIKKPLRKLAAKIKAKTENVPEERQPQSLLEALVQNIGITKDNEEEHKSKDYTIFLNERFRGVKVDYGGTETSEDGDIKVDAPFFFERQEFTEYSAPEAGGKVVEKDEWNPKPAEPGKTYEPKTPQEERSLFKEAPYIPKEDARGELRKKTEGKGIIDRRHEFY